MVQFNEIWSMMGDMETSPSTSPRKPKQPRAERTRAQILTAGAQLFAQYGFHGTSSKKIAKEAGISVGSFYVYFRDKKDLLLAIYQDHAQKVHQMVFDALKENQFLAGRAEGRQMVQMIIDQAMALHTLSPEFHREMTIMRLADRDIGEMMAAEDQRVTQMMVELLASQREALRVEDLESAAQLVVATVEEIVHSILIFAIPLPRERLLSALADLIHRFLFK
jgi:AcrR family transcriptional regulator